jgi:uncharacterized integral membrane protein
MIFTLILGFILGASAILFILQNTAGVSLSFLQWQFDTSLALVVILALLVGAVFALLFTLPEAIGSSFRLRRLRRENEALAKEAEAHKLAADQATARLADVQTPRPDVIDLSDSV